MKSLVANLDPPIAVSTSPRLGRMCVKSTVPRGHTGTLVYNSFRSNGIMTVLFNSLPRAIRNITETDVNICKQNLDHYLCTGAPPGFGRGGAKNFFSDLGICMSRSDMLRMAKPCALLGGFGGMPSREFFFKMVRFSV